MSELKIVEEREVLGKEFRIYGDLDNPLFLAKDVAEWIDYSKTSQGYYDVSTMISTVDNDEKGKYSSTNNLRSSWYLTEDGLYEVLMQSRKPIAKQFKKKVKQILKDIRKTGGHVANEDAFLDTYLPFADEQTRLLFRGTLETVRKQNEIIHSQKKEIEHKEDVIIGLVDTISLSEKRQIINRVVRKGGKRYSDRWNALYREFENKYHINLKIRLNSYNENNKPKLKGKLDYIEKVMGKIPELYEIACKLYENDVKALVEEMYELNGVKITS